MSNLRPRAFRSPVGQLLSGIGLAGLLLAQAACVSPAKPPARPSGPIPWTAAIGVLDVPSESSSCTATLVAPATIVTAAHCIFPRGEKLPADAMTFTPNAGAQRLPEVRVAEIVGMGVERMDPDKPEATPTELDWAVLRLATPITNIAPIPVEPVALAEIDRRLKNGQRLSSFGYGRYGISFADHLYQNESCELAPEWQELVDEADDRLVMTTCQVIKGDSGGPVLIGTHEADRRLIAVVSRYWRRPDGTVSMAVGASAFADRLGPAVDVAP